MVEAQQDGCAIPIASEIGGNLMKRKWLATLCLLSVAVFLTGCSKQQSPTQTFAEVTQYLGPAATAVPVNNDLTGVSDGDTITVLDSTKTQHKVRLEGIDGRWRATSLALL